MGALLPRSIGLLASVGAILAGPAVADAATSHPGIDYDLDGSPAPAPPALNQLDLYTPDGSTASDSRPVVVYVHGGGWRNGNKSSQISDKVSLFTGAGYVFASLNYRLSPDPIDLSYPASRTRFPAHPDDVGEAIAWIDRNVSTYGGDPTRILLIGHSAGAHLVSLVSTDPRYLRAYGMNPRHLIGTVPLDTDAYDVAKRVGTAPGSTKALYYSAFATPEENAIDNTWALASPINFADDADPEFLLVTQSRVPGRVGNSQAMAAALGQDPSTTVFLAPYDHGGINQAVGSPTDPAGETEAIMGFFARMVAASQVSEVRFSKRPDPKVEVKRGKRANVTFRFAARTAAAGYECRLDSRPFKPCESPRKLSRVGVGRHAFRVRAIASNGDRGPLRKARFRVVHRRR